MRYQHGIFALVTPTSFGGVKWRPRETSAVFSGYTKLRTMPGFDLAHRVFLLPFLLIPNKAAAFK